MNSLKIQDTILIAALPSVPFEGWSWKTLEAGAVAAGYAPDMARAVFPDGVAQAVSHFSGWADRAMLRELKSTDVAALRVRDRIRAGVMARLAVLEPYRDVVRMTLAYRSMPLRCFGAGKSLWATADAIWTWAGDDSRDYNRYTKRGLLSGILASVTLVWLNDQTADLSATRSFLDRRIENVLQFGKMTGKFRRPKTA